MKKTLPGFGLALALVLPALPQDKEKDLEGIAGEQKQGKLSARRLRSNYAVQRSYVLTPGESAIGTYSNFARREPLN